MIVLQIAGFLGSGKTTLMIRVGKAIGQSGRKVVIIVNEVGEVGVDGEVLAQQGLSTVEISEGCICCSLSGTLQSTLKRAKQELSPDVILIEPTGLALPNRINSIIRTSMIEPEMSRTVTLVDAFRVEDLLANTRQFFLRQVEHADVLALNKVDVMDRDRLDDVERTMEDLCPGVRMVRISAKTGEGVEALIRSLDI
jgi:G3E family GTPase